MANRFADGCFRLAVGIEDTFVPQAYLGQRALDEYELTQHYDRWAEDLGMARECGATTIRYGIPWYKVNPSPNRFVWDWLDRVVDRLDELGLETIADLMHYGTPLWLDNQFLNNAYPERVAEYAARVAERYHGRLTAFTPFNEPLTNAIYCGEIARWPPHLSGDDGFVKLVRALVRGIVATQAAVAELTGGDATFVHVEATMRYVHEGEDVPEEVAFLRGRSFLIEDLLTGGVDDAHPLADFLRRNGFDDDDFAWCREHVAQPEVMGINYYPHLSTFAHRAGEPRESWPQVDAGTTGLGEVVRAFADRYRVPVFLTETSATGSIAERARWLDTSIEFLLRLRDEGVDIAGYTWWPLFDLVDWVYREETGPVEDYLLSMGMYDLRVSEIGRLDRVQTAVVDRFQSHAQSLMAAR
ncbi:MAG TPA: family 1 glycosylhydrolase [Gaiellaceae bacterium]|nr:family 1 glycosylhydrolase [Gaiellaceae bacterium]